MFNTYGDGEAGESDAARRYLDRAYGVGGSSGHPFYQRLNELLEAERFDEFAEARCAKFYTSKYGRPSLRPGIYFRALMIGALANPHTYGCCGGVRISSRAVRAI